jgi:hypothetical protein
MTTKSKPKPKGTLEKEPLFLSDPHIGNADAGLMTPTGEHSKCHACHYCRKQDPADKLSREKEKRDQQRGDF